MSKSTIIELFPYIENGLAKLTKFQQEEFQEQWTNKPITLCSSVTDVSTEIISLRHYIHFRNKNDEKVMIQFETSAYLSQNDNYSIKLGSINKGDILEVTGKIKKIYAVSNSIREELWTCIALNCHEILKVSSCWLTKEFLRL